MNKKVISITLLMFLMLLPILSFAQLTTAPNGGNKKASVSEQIGVSKISIDYSRPGVKGR